MTTNNNCIYRHLKPCGEVFYIGIGKIRRSKEKTYRNKHWCNIVNKHGYETEILKSDLTWDDACELEKILISWYGRKDLKTGILCNLTDGGEGGYGAIVSETTREKMRLAKIDAVNYTCKKIINTKTGEIFDSLTSAAKIINIKRTTLNAKLSGQNKNNTNLEYYDK